MDCSSFSRVARGLERVRRRSGFTVGWQKCSERPCLSVSLVQPPLGCTFGSTWKSKQPLTPESELLLFAAARAQLVNGQIRPSLERGNIVISDRFSGSTVAYQGYGRGIGRHSIDYLNDYATGGLKPSVTFLLDI